MLIVNKLVKLAFSSLVLLVRKFAINYNQYSIWTWSVVKIFQEFMFFYFLLDNLMYIFDVGFLRCLLIFF